MEGNTDTANKRQAQLSLRAQRHQQLHQNVKERSLAHRRPVIILYHPIRRKLLTTKCEPDELKDPIDYMAQLT